MAQSTLRVGQTVDGFLYRDSRRRRLIGTTHRTRHPALW
jgi:predicted RNA-binding protein (virulence factor B family)